VTGCDNLQNLRNTFDTCLKQCIHKLNNQVLVKV